MANVFSLYTLSASQQTASKYVLQYVKQDYGLTEALEEYRSIGGKIRTSAWSTIYHIAEGGEQNPSVVALLNPSEDIALSEHALSQTKLSDNFSYNVETTGTDTQTGEEKIINTTVTSDVELSPDDIITTAERNISNSSKRYQIGIENSVLVSALVSYDYTGD